MKIKSLIPIVFCLMFMSSCAPGEAVPTLTATRTAAPLPTATLTVTPSETTPPLVPLVQDAVLFSGPGNIGYTTIAHLTKNELVQTIGSYHDFVLVETSEQIKGYIYKGDLKEIGTEVPQLSSIDVPLGTVDVLPIIYNRVSTYQDGIMRMDGLQSEDWQGFSEDNIEINSPFQIKVQFASAGDFATIIISGNQPVSGGVTRPELFLLADGRIQIQNSDNSNLNELPVNFTKGSPFYVKFNDPNGKSLSFIDENNVVLYAIDVTRELTGIQAPDGFLPDGYMSIGFQIAPKSSLVVSQLQLQNIPTGIYNTTMEKQCNIVVGVGEPVTTNNSLNSPDNSYLSLEGDEKVPSPDQLLIESAMAQYVISMKIAGLDLDAANLVSELQYKRLKDSKGNPFIAAVTLLDPNPSKTGEEMEGTYPILVASQQNDAWVWKIASLRDFADRLGIDFGAQTVSWKLNDPEYIQKIIAPNANFIIMDGEMNLSTLLGESNDTSEAIRQIIEQLDSGKTPTVNFEFRQADRLVNCAITNQMKIQANHIFMWGTIPEEIFNDLDNGKITFEQFDRFLEYYTKTLVGHFKGRIDEYSVINEVPGSILYNTPAVSRVTRILLENGTMQHIFEWAREADPDAILIYNDCIPRLGQSEDSNSRLLQEYIKDLKFLLDNDTPIDRAGMQGHVSIYVPSTREQMEKSFAAILDTGVPAVGFTEVTVSISPDDEFMQGSAYPAEYAQPINDPYIQQAKVITDMFEVMYPLRGTFLMFGITDAYSWDHDPSRTLDARSMILDENFQPKPAYYALMSVMLSHIAK